MKGSILLLTLATGALAKTLNDYQLYKQASVYSDEHRDELNNRPIKRMRMANCTTVTPVQIEAMLAEYPNFIVTCEKELSLLYPTELDEEQPTEKGIFGTSFKLNLGRKYNLTEMKVTVKEDLDTLRIPLFLCIYASHTNTSGSIEFKFTIGGGTSGSGSVTGGLPIPAFGIKSSLGVGGSFSRKFVIDHSCNFDGYGTRPTIAMTTMEVHVELRRWLVSAKATKPPQISKWQKYNRVVFTDDAPTFSCLSELYVPGVCNWPADRARDEDGDEVAISEMES